MTTRFDYKMSLIIRTSCLPQAGEGRERSHLTRGFETTFLHQREAYILTVNLKSKIQKNFWTFKLFASIMHGDSQGLEFSSFFLAYTHTHTHAHATATRTFNSKTRDPEYHDCTREP